MPVNLPADCKRVDDELDRQFQAPAPQLSSAAIQHVQNCKRCRELHRWIVGKSEDIRPSPEVRARIQTSLLSSLKPVKPAQPIVVSVLGFLVLFSALAAMLIGTANRTGFHEMNRAQFIALTAMFAVAATLFSVSLAWQMIPGSYQRIPIKWVVAGSGVGLLSVIGLLFPWQASEFFLAQGWPCSLSEITIAVPAGAVFWMLARRGAITSGPATGAAVGGIAGLLAVTVQQFRCPFQIAPHLLIWHLGVPAIVLAAGTLIGSIVPTRMAS